MPRDVYQFVVLCMAKRSGVAFIWADHLGEARKAGLPEALIAAIDTGETVFPEPFELVSRITAEAFAFKSIPQDLQDRCIDRFGTPGLLEIVTFSAVFIR